MSLGKGANLNGFRPFPADNPWNQDVSTAPLDPESDVIMQFIGSKVALHPDFGAGLDHGHSIGIPYMVVGGAQKKVGIEITESGSESYHGSMPIPGNAPVEGYPKIRSGDRHVLVLDNSQCWLYELYAASHEEGVWTADSAAVWDLLANQQRPWTWTSADAAGLPIFPGLVRYDEVTGGEIRHALRFTLERSRPSFVPPATHMESKAKYPLGAPMGMRIRLKAGFDISKFSPTNQVILRALKKYGMFMADNGGDLYVSGAPDERWDNADLHLLGAATAADFEVLKMDHIYSYKNRPQGDVPKIKSFTATTSGPGKEVTLKWEVSGASYFILSPQVGPVRGNSVTVALDKTTTYSLYATNQFGRSTAKLTVKAP